MPRLLYLNDAIAITGGLERVLTDKVNWLSKQKGYKIFVITVNQGFHPLAYPLSDDVTFHDLDVQFHTKYQYLGIKKFIISNRLHHIFRTRLIEKIRELSPDIIICTRLDYLHDILKIKGSIPLIFESHSFYLSWRYDGSRRLRKLHIKWMQRYVRKVQMTVALTNGDANDWQRLTKNVNVIPNVVHLNNSCDYSDCNSKTAIFAGRLCLQKDLLSLFRIWKSVQNRHPDWCLNIYGDGELKEEICYEIDMLNANVNLCPPSSNIMEKYKEGSILLMTSLYEPFGLVLAEAMSCGIPVIAFDCPYGPADVIADGKDGFLIKDRNIEEFVEKVCWLIENPELRRSMGQAGIQSSRRYDASLIMPKWKALFEQLI